MFGQMRGVILGEVVQMILLSSVIEEVIKDSSELESQLIE